MKKKVLRHFIKNDTQEYYTQEFVIYTLTDH